MIRNIVEYKMKLCDETEFSLMLFGHLARSGLIKDCGDITKFCNSFMEYAKEQKYIITRDSTVPSILESDGSKFQNFIVNKNGTIERPQHNINGILIVYIDDIDDDGNSYLKPVVSTLCIDNELSELLSSEARSLLKHIGPILHPI